MRRGALWGVAGLVLSLLVSVATPATSIEFDIYAVDETTDELITLNLSAGPPERRVIGPAPA